MIAKVAFKTAARLLLLLLVLLLVLLLKLKLLLLLVVVVKLLLVLIETWMMKKVVDIVRVAIGIVEVMVKSECAM